MIRKSKLLAFIIIVSIFTYPISCLAAEATWGSKKVDPMLTYTVGLPFKVVGSLLSSTTGVLVGATRGFMHGAVKGTKVVASALGDEAGAGENLIGIAIGAVPGATLYGIRGGSVWGAKGLKVGWGKPFEQGTVHSALKGIPDAIEWTTKNAAKEVSSANKFSKIFPLTG